MSSHLRNPARGMLTAALVILSAVAPARASITPAQVLVVYNSASPEAVTLKNSYLAAHPDIPSFNVLDLNNAALVAADITYTQFVSLVRNPIRSYLLLPGAGRPTPTSVVVIVLIRPFPHRILDTDNATVGDFPQQQLNELLAGDATDASVDSELTLLWQNLETGEAGGTMDSHSDNFIDNPFHQSTSGIQAFSRSNIVAAKTFVNDPFGGSPNNIDWIPGGSGASLLTPGDMMLVCRIDGFTLADAQAQIARAGHLIVNKARVKVLLDEFDENTCNGLDHDGVYVDGPGDPYWGGDDYELARDTLQATGWTIRHDRTFTFITPSLETSPLIAYASYGRNHGFGGCGETPSATYIQGFRFWRGAVFNSIESFNGRALNGLGTLFNQDQCADFIASGGTFAVGNVWEPLAFAVPDNAFILDNFLNRGLSWAESAWTGIPALSWQQIVIGDPLATAAVVNDPGGLAGDLNADGRVDGQDIALFTQLVIIGAGPYHAQFPALDPITRADFSGDLQVTSADQPGFVAALLN